MTNTVKITIDLPASFVAALPAIAVIQNIREEASDEATMAFYAACKRVFQAMTDAHGEQAFSEQVMMAQIGLDVADDALALIFEKVIDSLDTPKAE